MKQLKFVQEARERRAHDDAMRSVIRRVRSGENVVTIGTPIEELAIVADCIICGYINGSISEQDGAKRMMDGRIYPVVYSNYIPEKGLYFLYPALDWRFLIPTVISIIALFAH